MKRLVILGAPGAGKGTQANKICELLAISTFSTGAMFRAQIEKGTALGQQAKTLIDRGDLVPDSITDPMVKDTLADPQYADGFLMDGFPRSVSQAKYLTEVLKALDVKLDAVLNLDVELEDVVTRMLHRAQIEHRPDDTEPVIRHRLEVYKQQTQPVVDFYEAAGLLITVDGNGTIDEVWERIKAALTK